MIPSGPENSEEGMSHTSFGNTLERRSTFSPAACCARNLNSKCKLYLEQLAQAKLKPSRTCKQNGKRFLFEASLPNTDEVSGYPL